jgi:hypothetical protein
MKIENSIPNALHLSMAMTAFSIHHIISGHMKPHPFNHFAAAVRAKRVLALLARNISTINISKPCLHANLPRPMKQRGRGPRKVQHLISRIKSRDMPGHLRPQGKDELRDLFKFLF